MTRATARLVRHRLAYLGATAAILAAVVRSEAQDDIAFHEIETKYIFGFTIGSSVGLEGEKAFEPDSVAGLGKRTGTYAASETELEYEFTPNQYMQIELGPRFPITIFTTSLTSLIGVWQASMALLVN